MWKASRWEEGAKVRGGKEVVRMGGILYSIWAIRLSSRELDLAAEEAIVSVASSHELILAEVWSPQGGLNNAWRVQNSGV
jgi:hypothetical protein